MPLICPKTSHAKPWSFSACYISDSWARRWGQLQFIPVQLRRYIKAPWGRHQILLPFRCHVPVKAGRESIWPLSVLSHHISLYRASAMGNWSRRKLRKRPGNRKTSSGYWKWVRDWISIIKKFLLVCSHCVRCSIGFEVPGICDFLHFFEQRDVRSWMQMTSFTTLTCLGHTLSEES